MKGCSAGRHPPVSALVKTIRSPSSTARKQALRCGCEGAAVLAHQGHEGAAGARSMCSTLHLAGAGIHHCSKLARIGPGAPDGRPRRLDDARDREVEFGIARLGHLACLLLAGCGDELLEPVGARLPRGRAGRTASVSTAANGRFSMRAGAHAALLARADQAALLEQMDVLHEGRQRHVERLRQFADARRPLAQPPQHGPARGIGQGLEDAVELR